jgi:hypothetical protein
MPPDAQSPGAPSALPPEVLEAFGNELVPHSDRLRPGMPVIYELGLIYKETSPTTRCNIADFDRAGRPVAWRSARYGEGRAATVPESAT